MKKALMMVVIFLLLLSILFSGCEDTVKEDDNDDYLEDDFDEDDDIDDGDEDNGEGIPSPVDVSSIPDYNELSLDSLPTEVRLDVPPRRNVAGFCYLESYSMMLAYLDSSIDAPEVFASAGLGAPIICDTYIENRNLRPCAGFVAYLQIRSMKSYGLQWVDVYAEDEFSEFLDDPYLEDASGKIAHLVEDNLALSYLKAVLHSGRPVQVHLDLYYLDNYNLKLQDFPEGSSHFMVITGYDENNIYLSDTYAVESNKDEFKDMAVPTETFMDAWYHGGTINEGDQGPYYWMLFFINIDNSDITRPVFTDVISVQKNLSEEIEEHFDLYISKIESGEYDPSNTPWLSLANIKQLFAEYLRNNGYNDAADAYDSLYSDYQTCQGNPDEITTDMLTNIKANEVYARNLLA